MSEKDKKTINTDLSIEDAIGGRLKTAREGMGLSQTDLHKITGLSRMVISKYESGQNKPGARELRLLCDALKISPSHLIYGTETPHTVSESFADIILNMGEAGLLTVAMIVPMIGASLGKDDTRTLLNLTESLLKAKRPQDYEMISEFLAVFKEMTLKNPKEIQEITNSQELTEKLQREYAERLEAVKQKHKK